MLKPLKLWVQPLALPANEQKAGQGPPRGSGLHAFGLAVLARHTPAAADPRQGAQLTLRREAGEMAGGQQVSLNLRLLMNSYSDARNTFLIGRQAILRQLDRYMAYTAPDARRETLRQAAKAVDGVSAKLPRLSGGKALPPQSKQTVVNEHLTINEHTRKKKRPPAKPRGEQHPRHQPQGPGRTLTLPGHLAMPPLAGMWRMETSLVVRTAQLVLAREAARLERQLAASPAVPMHPAAPGPAVPAPRRRPAAMPSAPAAQPGLPDGAPSGARGQAVPAPALIYVTRPPELSHVTAAPVQTQAVPLRPEARPLGAIPAPAPPQAPPAMAVLARTVGQMVTLWARGAYHAVLPIGKEAGVGPQLMRARSVPYTILRPGPSARLAEALWALEMRHSGVDDTPHSPRLVGEPDPAPRHAASPSRTNIIPAQWPLSPASPARVPPYRTAPGGRRAPWPASSASVRVGAYPGLASGQSLMYSPSAPRWGHRPTGVSFLGERLISNGDRVRQAPPAPHRAMARGRAIPGGEAVRLPEALALWLPAAQVSPAAVAGPAASVSELVPGGTPFPAVLAHAAPQPAVAALATQIGGQLARLARYSYPEPLSRVAARPALGGPPMQVLERWHHPRPSAGDSALSRQLHDSRARTPHLLKRAPAPLGRYPTYGAQPAGQAPSDDTAPRPATLMQGRGGPALPADITARPALPRPGPHPGPEARPNGAGPGRAMPPAGITALSTARPLHRQAARTPGPEPSVRHPGPVIHRQRAGAHTPAAALAADLREAVYRPSFPDMGPLGSHPAARTFAAPAPQMGRTQARITRFTPPAAGAEVASPLAQRLAPGMVQAAGPEAALPPMPLRLAAYGLPAVAEALSPEAASPAPPGLTHLGARALQAARWATLAAGETPTAARAAAEGSPVPEGEAALDAQVAGLPLHPGAAALQRAAGIPATPAVTAQTVEHIVEEVLEGQNLRRISDRVYDTLERRIRQERRRFGL